jgi:hypothetical protein
VKSRCAECKWKYPYGYLNRLHTSQGDTDPICGICAEQLISKVHGQPTKLHGPMAIGIRDSAVEWRRAHPEDDPTAGDKRKGGRA